MDKVTKHCYVSGLVQGVFYRASTVNKAKQLQVTGWIKNLADGRVEALLSGDTQNVEDLLEWMKVGPEQAQVDGIEITKLDWQGHTDFTVH